MKLLKGLFAIALISMIAVSCTSEKKEADATKEKVEVVDGDDSKAAEHKCDENCKEGNCPHHAKMKGHKCDENCTKENCPMMQKMDGKKCADAKCSKDCTDKDCAKCAAKKAECKAKCEAKKSEKVESKE